MRLITVAKGSPLTGQAVIAMLVDGTVADRQAASGRSGALSVAQLRTTLQARGIILGQKRPAGDLQGAEVFILHVEGGGAGRWALLDAGEVWDPWLEAAVRVEHYGEQLRGCYPVRWADGSEQGAARPPDRETGGAFDASAEGLDVRGSSGVWVDVRGLVPWSGNYNEHPREQLDAIHASIDRFGWTEPILVHRASGRIIGGHGRRLVALEKLERDPKWRLADAPAPGFVPMRWSDVTASEAEALAIADNEIATLRVRNDVQLGRVLEGLRARDGELGTSALASIGMRDADVTRLLQRQAPKDPAKVEAPPPPPKPKNPVSKPGEVYQLGRHRLRCGESLDAEALAELLDGTPADLCFMDPPYAIYGSSTGVGADIADDGMIRPFFRDVLMHASASLRLFGLLWVCCDWRSWSSWWEVTKGTDLRVKNAIKSPVEKALMSSRTTGIRAVHAPNVFHLGDQGEAPAPRESEGADALYDDRNVFQSNRVSGAARVHNAQKPVELICDVMRPACRTGEVVIDLFGGSGSTMIAAEKLGLRARLSERDPGWCDVIRKRWGTFARECGIDPGDGAL